MENHDIIIAKTIQHIIDFVEKPHPVFGGMPVCPFAKKARLGNKIRFEVLAFETVEDLIPLVSSFTREHELMQVLHPGKIECCKLYDLAGELNESITKNGLQVFCGHPEDTFNIAGVYTRREPYPTLQVIWQDVAKAAEDKLSERYYKNWQPWNYAYANIIHATDRPTETSGLPPDAPRSEQPIPPVPSTSQPGGEGQSP